MNDYRKKLHHSIRAVRIESIGAHISETAQRYYMVLGTTKEGREHQVYDPEDADGASAEGMYPSVSAAQEAARRLLPGSAVWSGSNVQLDGGNAPTGCQKW